MNVPLLSAMKQYIRDSICKDMCKWLEKKSLQDITQCRVDSIIKSTERDACSKIFYWNRVGQDVYINQFLLFRGLAFCRLYKILQI